ncbi:hypothetical protein [Nocardia sp. NPDC050412]|uniref:hypothetical protein n=1 Tax=Nocardia sp. NPDC050412 TaxID=3364320 RepID=UPI0037B62C64
MAGGMGGNSMCLPLAPATARPVQASVGIGRVQEDLAIRFDLQAENSALALKPENVTVNDGLGGD